MLKRQNFKRATFYTGKMCTRQMCTRPMNTRRMSTMRMSTRGKFTRQNVIEPSFKYETIFLLKNCFEIKCKLKLPQCFPKNSESFNSWNFSSSLNPLIRYSRGCRSKETCWHEKDNNVNFFYISNFNLIRR